ncbi:hypothetical protein BDZ90DRAFT_42714 [Jaminaea rosea]|uniref:Uncharacterized protein n=1 Tax=Jaminaea rosea TaxID=1569628 RepID=A0A316UMR8_9BASI|nr:hypothetical protein BDZ90DRAFT_42714 [Jaminaea rosea]PWN26592.1 hypothetical protein BDZ90DRAFT_42714 [Jaminaea rosea]
MDDRRVLVALSSSLLAVNVKPPFNDESRRAMSRDEGRSHHVARASGSASRARAQPDPCSFFPPRSATYLELASQRKRRLTLSGEVMRSRGSGGTVSWENLRFHHQPHPRRPLAAGASGPSQRDSSLAPSGLTDARTAQAHQGKARQRSRIGSVDSSDTSNIQRVQQQQQQQHRKH